MCLRRLSIGAGDRSRAKSAHSTARSHNEYNERPSTSTLGNSLSFRSTTSRLIRRRRWHLGKMRSISSFHRCASAASRGEHRKHSRNCCMCTNAGLERMSSNRACDHCRMVSSRVCSWQGWIIVRHLKFSFRIRVRTSATHSKFPSGQCSCRFSSVAYSDRTVVAMSLRQEILMAEIYAA